MRKLSLSYRPTNLVRFVQLPWEYCTIDTSDNYDQKLTFGYLISAIITENLRIAFVTLKNNEQNSSFLIAVVNSLLQEAKGMLNNALYKRSYYLAANVSYRKILFFLGQDYINAPVFNRLINSFVSSVFLFVEHSTQVKEDNSNTALIDLINSIYTCQFASTSLVYEHQFFSLLEYSKESINKKNELIARLRLIGKKRALLIDVAEIAQLEAEANNVLDEMKGLLKEGAHERFKILSGKYVDSMLLSYKRNQFLSSIVVISIYLIYHRKFDALKLLIHPSFTFNEDVDFYSSRPMISPLRLDYYSFFLLNKVHIESMLRGFWDWNSGTTIYLEIYNVIIFNYYSKLNNSKLDTVKVFREYYNTFDNKEIFDKISIARYEIEGTLKHMQSELFKKKTKDCPYLDEKEIENLKNIIISELEDIKNYEKEINEKTPIDKGSIEQDGVEIIKSIESSDKLLRKLITIGSGDSKSIKEEVILTTSDILVNWSMEKRYLSTDFLAAESVNTKGAVMTECINNENKLLVYFLDESVRAEGLISKGDFESVLDKLNGFHILIFRNLSPESFMQNGYKRVLYWHSENFNQVLERLVNRQIDDRSLGILDLKYLVVTHYDDTNNKQLIVVGSDIIEVNPYINSKIPIEDGAINAFNSESLLYGGYYQVNEEAVVTVIYKKFGLSLNPDAYIRKYSIRE